MNTPLLTLRLVLSSLVLALVPTLLVLPLVFLMPSRVSAGGDLLLFGDSLQNGFTDNWSFDTSFDTNTTAPTYDGSARSVRVTYLNGNWGAWWLRREAGDVNLANYTAIRFAIHGGSAGGQQLRVQADSGANYPTHEVELSAYLPGGPVANEWRVVTIPLSDLNLQGSTLGTVASKIGAITLSSSSSSTITATVAAVAVAALVRACQPPRTWIPTRAREAPASRPICPAHTTA
jgi:hypothetical protein